MIILSPNKQVVPGWIKPVDERTMKLLDYDTGEIPGLILDTILERYPLDELSKVISYYGNKVQKGSPLRLMGPDLMKFSIEFSHHRLKNEDFRIFSGLQSHLSIDRILDNVPSGFKLISWEHQGLNYLITLERS
jgi:hypothetical protein